MRHNPIKAFFEYGYLDGEDIDYLEEKGIEIEIWHTNEDYEQRICLSDLNNKQKEEVKVFVTGRNQKYVDEFDYVIFY